MYDLTQWTEPSCSSAQCLALRSLISDKAGCLYKLALHAARIGLQLERPTLHFTLRLQRFYPLLSYVNSVFRENDTVTVQRLCHPTQDFILAKGNEISRKEKGADFVIRLDTSVARRPPAELSAAVHTAVLSF